MAPPPMGAPPPIGSAPGSPGPVSPNDTSEKLINRTIEQLLF